MCKSNWCGYCNTDTEKKDLRARSHVAHVCKCCDLTTSITDNQGMKWNVVIRDKENTHEQA